MSSQFQKPDTKKITRSDWQAVGPPYIPTRYAEIDAVLSNKRLRNSVKNIESDTITAFPSDHFPGITKIKIKLAKNRNIQKDESNTWKSPKKPSEEQLTSYNNHIVTELRNLEESINSNVPPKERINQKVTALSHTLKTAAEQHFEKRDTKNTDISRSPELEALFTDRQRRKTEGNYEEAKRITYRIRKRIKKERTDNNIKNLEDHLWHDIKKAKSTFIPSHTKLKRKDGTICESKERPHILADYFENEQWGINHEREKETSNEKRHHNASCSGRTSLPGPPDISEDKITMEELRAVIKKLKNNKSPGPDGIPVEFFKRMSEESLLIVLDILNDCWENEIMPDEMN